MQDSNPETWKPNETPKTILNPLSTPFSCEYRDDENTKRTILIGSIDTVTLPTWLADHVCKHLVNEIVNVRKLGYLTPEKRAAIEKEIVNG